LHYNVGKCVFLPLQQYFYSKSRHASPQNSSQIYAYACLVTIVQCPWPSYLHLSASVTKQYNLVLVKGQWCSEAWKVTHWTCVTDFVVYPPSRSRPT